MQFGVSKNILRTNRYTALAVTIDASTEGTVTINGQKILPAGTVLMGVEGPLFDDKTRLATKATGDSPVYEGVLLSDTDLTKGNAPGACVYQGEIYQDKVIDYTAALKTADGLQLIKFVK